LVDTLGAITGATWRGRETQAKGTDTRQADRRGAADSLRGHFTARPFHCEAISLRGHFTARPFHCEAIVIDGHNDLPYRLRERPEPFYPRYDISKPQPKLHTDI
jgi:hypothetical protein